MSQLKHFIIMGYSISAINSTTTIATIINQHFSFLNHTFRNASCCTLCVKNEICISCSIDAQINLI